jgi:hypothetical protein
MLSSLGMEADRTEILLPTANLWLACLLNECEVVALANPLELVTYSDHWYCHE